jgi:nitroimidazol reductase NimA-like FMN-containing flavoprotein (pyridoxamine 5'-phosphate oxidase superfamily)
MLIHDLTDAECEAMLARTNVGRLACSRDNQPYIIPVSFSFDPYTRSLYSFSTLGQKIQWMRLNPRVCVEVDEIVDRFHWTTVLVMGRYEELDDSPPNHAARERAQQLLQERDTWWLPGGGKLAGSAEHDHPVIYRIRIDKVSGRRAARAS